jgi:hypothetical protein
MFAPNWIIITNLGAQGNRGLEVWKQSTYESVESSDCHHENNGVDVIECTYINSSPELQLFAVLDGFGALELAPRCTKAE